MQALGAHRCQTFTDEARSEGYVGVEGDDPSIYWTYKEKNGFGPNDGKTAGSYAVDDETGESISTQHQAVLFNDRVTLADFHRGNKNCSYFAVAPLEIAQAKLAYLLRERRANTLAEAAARGDDVPHAQRPPWHKEKSPEGVDAAAPPSFSASASTASQRSPAQPVSEGRILRSK